MSPKMDTLNIAHRGARSLAPENTLLAAQKGFDAGADLWELDVAMTSDGEIVVIHDDTLERTSNAAQIYAERRPFQMGTSSFADFFEFKFENPMEVPRLLKVTVNMGLGEAVQNGKIIESAVEELTAIVGQKPVVTRARKAIERQRAEHQNCQHQPHDRPLAIAVQHFTIHRSDTL